MQVFSRLRLQFYTQVHGIKSPLNKFEFTSGYTCRACAMSSLADISPHSGLPGLSSSRSFILNNCDLHRRRRGEAVVPCYYEAEYSLTLRVGQVWLHSLPVTHFLLLAASAEQLALLVLFSPRVYQGLSSIQPPMPRLYHKLHPWKVRDSFKSQIPVWQLMVHIRYSHRGHFHLILFYFVKKTWPSQVFNHQFSARVDWDYLV